MSRLAGEGLVTRAIDAADRRRSINRLTASGKGLLTRLDRHVSNAAKETMGHLGRARLTALVDLLEAFDPPPLS
jgi:DNA-binding MarR family transcriptional regulator